MTKRTIYITEFDKDRLEKLIGSVKASADHTRGDLVGLASELAQAQVVPSSEVPQSVVTMNSKILMRDLETSEEMVYTLVFPADADADRGSISILAPIGTAILGYAEGDVVEWPVPSGACRIRIEKILYQPEAAGDFHL